MLDNLAFYLLQQKFIPLQPRERSEKKKMTSSDDYHSTNNPMINVASPFAQSESWN